MTTVKELIENLSNLDPDAVVVYHDSSKFLFRFQDVLPVSSADVVPWPGGGYRLKTNLDSEGVKAYCL